MCPLLRGVKQKITQYLSNFHQGFASPRSCRVDGDVTLCSAPTLLCASLLLLGTHPWQMRRCCCCWSRAGMGWERENRALLVCDSHSRPRSLCLRNGNAGGTPTSPAALPVPALQLRPRCQGVHGHPWDLPRREEGGGRWLWAGDGAGRGVTLPGGCFRGHHHGEISAWEVLDVSCGCWRVNNPTRPLVLLLGCFQPWQSFGMDALPVPGEQPGASPFLVEVKNSWGGL